MTAFLTHQKRAFETTPSDLEDSATRPKNEEYQETDGEDRRILAQLLLSSDTMNRKSNAG